MFLQKNEINKLYVLHYDFCYHFISKMYTNKCEKKKEFLKKQFMLQVYVYTYNAQIYCFSAPTCIKLNPE